jgi:hypothetical protein
MGQQAAALGYPIHHISGVETGKTAPSEEYISTFALWLGLGETEIEALRRRAKSNLVSLHSAAALSNNSNSMRLFRKVSKMDSRQIRAFRTKIEAQIENERRFSSPPEVS